MPVFSSHKHDWMIGFSIHGPLDHDGRVWIQQARVHFLISNQDPEYSGGGRNPGPVWPFA